MQLQSDTRIAIVTPTYERVTLLKRFIRQVLRQDYNQWTLVIVHDGENRQTREIVNRFARQDSRIHFLHTERRFNDFGNTPRLFGLKFVSECNLADYIVFWDDDNSFYPGALSSIGQSLLIAGMPDVLLVPIRYGKDKLPQRLPVEQLSKGQVDTANFVVRTSLLSRVFENMLQSIPPGGHAQGCSDFRLLYALREEIGPSSFQVATCQPIGRYDGLRPLVTMRWMLCIPSLGMSRFAWFRWLRQCFCVKNY